MPSSKPPTAEELDRVAVLCARPEARGYFFDRLENPSWVTPLATRGFFEHPPPAVPADEENYFRFPPWAEGRYLARVASAAPSAVAAILEGLSASDNPAVTSLLFKALVALPDPHFGQLTEKAKEWVSAPFADHFAEEAGAVVLRLLESGRAADGLGLVARLMELRPDPRRVEKEAAGGYRPTLEAAARFSEWEYERLLGSFIKPMIEAAGMEALRLLLRLLDQAQELSRWEGESADDHSYLWRPSIGDHEQNWDSGIRSALVSAVRDGSVRLATASPADTDVIVGELELASVVTRRVALHLLSVIPDRADLAAARMTDRDVFDDFRLRREYAELLRTRFGELGDDSRGIILGWIADGPDVEEFRQRTTDFDGASPPADEIERYRDQWRRDRLSFIEAYLRPDEAEGYRALVEVLGAPQHPEFSSWSESWVGPESPVTAAELGERSPIEVIDYLRKWRPDETAGSFTFGPSVEGLGRAFSEVAESRAAEFVELAPEFVHLDPTYARELFSALERAQLAGTTFGWQGPLDLAATVAEVPFEPDIEVPDRDRDPGWRWCRRAIGSFIRAGLAASNAIPFEMRTAVWGVIRRLTDDPNPSPDHEAKYGGDNMDPMALSINTNRGTAMHAVVEYGLWCRRHLEADGTDVTEGARVIPEVATVLDAHLEPTVDPSPAIRAVYGRWLPWLVLYDEAWTVTQLSRMFPRAGQDAHLRDAAWQTYIASCPPYDSAFRVLRDEYNRAISDVPSEDRKVAFRHESIDSRLGQHLVTLYWRGVLDRSLLEAFFDRAGDPLAGDVLRFVGRALREADGGLLEPVAERIRELWEWRFSLAGVAPVDHRHELRAFGGWFGSGKLEDEWALPFLERVVELVGAPNLGQVVAERLVEVSESQPAVAVRVLAGMVEKPEREWDYLGWRSEARAIVERALSSEAFGVREPVAAVVDFYVQRGELEFRELVRNDS